MICKKTGDAWSIVEKGLIKRLLQCTSKARLFLFWNNVKEYIVHMTVGHSNDNAKFSLNTTNLTNIQIKIHTKKLTKLLNLLIIVKPTWTQIKYRLFDKQHNHGTIFTTAIGIK